MAVSSTPTTGRITDSVTVPARSAGAEASRLPLLVRHPRRHADHPVADEGHGIVGLQRQKLRSPIHLVEGPDPNPPARWAMMHWRVSSHRRPILSMRTTTKISPLEKRPARPCQPDLSQKKHLSHKPEASSGCSTLRCTVRIPPNDPSPLTPHGNGMPSGIRFNRYPVFRPYL